ncbi:MAG: LLM class F420-dependent oxidoreductase [Candidatus Binatia bacterium]
MTARVRFSVQTPVESTTFAALARHWQTAEMLGYDCAWLDDHFYSVTGPPTDDSLECWTLMAALARETTRLRFGTLVMCQSYRNPALLAKMAATLDHVSDGRLEFGLGAGWFENEYRAYGYDFPAMGARLRQLEEALEICTRLWHGDRATFSGRHYRIDDNTANPKPVQQPHPPIMIGGGGEKVLLRLVAQYADCWNFGGSVDEFRQKIAVLDRHCAAVGRPPAAIERSWFGNIIIEPNQAKLDERVAKRAARGHADAYGLNTLVGTPEQIIARLHEYIAAGVTHFIGMFGRVERLGATELFAREVIPAFR